MMNSNFPDIKQELNTSEPPDETFGYKCENCSQEFEMESRFKQHQKLQVCARHECDICHKVLQDKDESSLHRKIVHNIFYAWEACGEAFLKKTNLVEHREEAVFYCCLICNKRFPSVRGLNVHKRSVHFDLRRFPCDVCEQIFVHKYDLIKHKSSVHDEAKALRCETCNKLFTLKGTLVRHQNMIHLGMGVFKCDFCESCNDQDEFTQHKINVHSSVKLHVCRVCKKSFAKEKQLVEHHIFTHSETREFACNVCGKKFALKRLLRNHLRHVHSDHEELTCNECGKKFKSKQSLHRHMIVHSGTASHVCDTCGQSFRLFRSLLAHKERFHREHSGICKTHITNIIKLLKNSP